MRPCRCGGRRAEPAIKRGSYLGPSLGSCFLISGLSYKTTFNSELVLIVPRSSWDVAHD